MVSAVPEVTPATYSPLATLGNDFTLTGGVVKAAVDGQEIVVDGTWSWQDADITPTVINSGYTAVFTPTDSTSYDSITSVVPVTITKAVPVIKTVPKHRILLMDRNSLKVYYPMDLQILTVTLHGMMVISCRLLYPIVKEQNI